MMVLEELTVEKMEVLTCSEWLQAKLTKEANGMGNLEVIGHDFFFFLIVRPIYLPHRN